MLNNNPLKLVETVKYLGHILTSDLNDDLDLERELGASVFRSNMLARRFSR